MKVMILGYEPVQYIKKSTQEEKTGISLYYAAENSKTVGLMTADTWIDKKRDPKLYDLVLTLDVTKPLPAEFDMDFEVGSRYPRIVGIKV